MRVYQVDLVVVVDIIYHTALVKVALEQQDKETLVAVRQ
jgi:hypothetical protein